MRNVSGRSLSILLISSFFLGASAPAAAQTWTPPQFIGNGAATAVAAIVGPRAVDGRYQPPCAAQIFRPGNGRKCHRRSDMKIRYHSRIVVSSGLPMTLVSPAVAGQPLVHSRNALRVHKNQATQLLRLFPARIELGIEKFVASDVAA